MYKQMYRPIIQYVFYTFSLQSVKIHLGYTTLVLYLIAKYQHEHSYNLLTLRTYGRTD